MGDATARLSGQHSFPPSAVVPEWSLERKLSFLFYCTRNQRRRNGSIHTGYCPLLNSQRKCGIIYTFLVTPCLCHLTTVQSRPRVRYSCTDFTLGNEQFTFKVIIQYFETSTLIFRRNGARRRWRNWHVSPAVARHSCGATGGRYVGRKIDCRRKSFWSATEREQSHYNQRFAESRHCLWGYTAASGKGA
jgi:hypothetical protein